MTNNSTSEYVPPTYTILNCPEMSLDVAFITPPSLGVFQMPAEQDDGGVRSWALCVLGRMVSKDRSKWSRDSNFRQIRRFNTRVEAVEFAESVRSGDIPPEQMIIWQHGDQEAVGERVPTAEEIERQLRISRRHQASAYAGRHGRRSRWA